MHFDFRSSRATEANQGICNSPKNSVLTKNQKVLCKATFILHGLDHILLDHPKVRYFTKSMRINCPLSLTKRNIMSLNDLKKPALCCNKIPNGQVFKAVFLISFFAFLRISNVAPHARGAFDLTVHLTLSDITISKKLMKITLK